VRGSATLNGYLWRTGRLPFLERREGLMAAPRRRPHFPNWRGLKKWLYCSHGWAGRLFSNPRKIYEDLWYEYKNQEEHSRVIKDLKKTFRRLAKNWLAEGEITDEQYAEIIASIHAPSWRIWKPVLYVIPRASMDPRRIIEVKRPDRAGYGPEFQIVDLKRHEFDIIDLSNVRTS
jgi:hypothetical protein